MDLPGAICTQARELPVQLQREALDFISCLGQRYNIPRDRAGALSTAALLDHAKCV